MRENNKDLNTNWQVYYYENYLNYIIEEKKKHNAVSQPISPKTSPFLRTPPKKHKKKRKTLGLDRYLSKGLG